MPSLHALENRTATVKKIILENGFDSVGIAKARRLDEEESHLEEWLNKGYQGEMSYLENHFEKRLDPRKLVPGAKSVIVVSANYFPSESQKSNDVKIARYAYGRDYHKVLKKKFKKILFDLQEELGNIEGRYFVDSAPVMERQWAEKTGIGWLGKNTLLINPKKGSYFFLGVIISDLELQEDAPIKDYCGTCRKCIDACPTDAFGENGYVLDASKCISYLTIELKNNIPANFKGKMENWVFGCDICQEVCPWNKFSNAHKEQEFNARPEILDFTKDEWEEISESIFNSVFEGSAVKRTGFEGLKRNIKFLDVN